jgi:hypothetical protein
MIINAEKQNGMNYEIRISNLEEGFKNYKELLKTVENLSKQFNEKKENQVIIFF